MSLTLPPSASRCLPSCSSPFPTSVHSHSDPHGNNHPSNNIHAEYWHYLDRPDIFASIGDSDDELGRLLACLRFWFTKDLKYVKGKPCKPYNSTLGEFFRVSRVPVSQIRSYL